MFHSFMRLGMRYLMLMVLGAIFVPVMGSMPVRTIAPVVHPLVSDWEFLASGPTPPTAAACNAVGRRCFTPEE